MIGIFAWKSLNPIYRKLRQIWDVLEDYGDGFAREKLWNELNSGAQVACVSMVPFGFSVPSVVSDSDLAWILPQLGWGGQKTLIHNSVRMEERKMEKVFPEMGMLLSSRREHPPGGEGAGLWSPR